MPNIKRAGAHSIGLWTGAKRRKVVRERCLLFETSVTYLWYGVVAGDGLRSAEEVTFPIQGRLLYPSHRARRLRAGALGHFTRPALVRGPGFWERPRPLLYLLPSPTGRGSRRRLAPAFCYHHRPGRGLRQHPPGPRLCAGLRDEDRPKCAGAFVEKAHDLVGTDERLLASRCGRIVYPPYIALILERHARSSSRRFTTSSARSSNRVRFSRGSSERSKNSSGWSP
jgi:hypothetical protein